MSGPVAFVFEYWPLMLLAGVLGFYECQHRCARRAAVAQLRAGSSRAVRAPSPRPHDWALDGKRPGPSGHRPPHTSAESPGRRRGART